MAMSGQVSQAQKRPTSGDLARFCWTGSGGHSLHVGRWSIIGASPAYLHGHECALIEVRQAVISGA